MMCVNGAGRLVPPPVAPAGGFAAAGFWLAIRIKPRFRCSQHIFVARA